MNLAICERSIITNKFIKTIFMSIFYEYPRVCQTVQIYPDNKFFILYTCEFLLPTKHICPV